MTKSDLNLIRYQSKLLSEGPDCQGCCSSTRKAWVENLEALAIA